MKYTVLVTKPQMGNGINVLDYITFRQSQDREKILAGYHNPKASYRPGQILEINYLAIWVRHGYTESALHYISNLHLIQQRLHDTLYLR